MNEAATSKHFTARGKLLLTGEYLVLEGAESLALPVRYQQKMVVSERAKGEGRVSGQIEWVSYAAEEALPWFQAIFDIVNFDIQEVSRGEQAVAQRLQQILRAIRVQDAKFLVSNQISNQTSTQSYASTSDLRVECTCDFPRAWGLGTSSTLLVNLAQWARVDPHQLLAATFGGSGYDIACGLATSPIIYQRVSESERRATPISFAPKFQKNLYFVFLEHKQNSRDSIQLFQGKKRQLTGVELDRAMAQINALTQKIATTQDYGEFCQAIAQHEAIIGGVVGKEPILQEWRQRGGIDSASSSAIKIDGMKSLGGWGGDFALLASSSARQDIFDFFQQHGYKTVIPFSEML